MQAETKTHSTSSMQACQNCKKDFEITPDDFGFYEKIGVPAPTWCPYCRLQRRLCFRNERTLYKRNCDLCSKSVISIYQENTKFPVYCRDCYFSDKWDATTFFQDYDPNRNFFIQIKELSDKVPQIALQSTNSVNSEYINQAMDCKNCYLVTSASDNEDCLYSNRLLNCKNICDCQSVGKLENSYDSIESRESSGLVSCEDCHGSFDLYFCYDARNSNSCFMSANLRSKSNVWYGEQLSKEDFEKRMSEIDLGSYEVRQKLIKEFEILKNKSLTRFSKQKNTQNCTGNVISNSKNAKKCFYLNEVENAHNLLFVDNVKDVHDANNTCCTAENMYEINTGGGNCANIFFSSDVWPEVRDTYYSLSCRNNVHDLFGCVGLRQKSFCILNKEYTKEEYEILKNKIIEDMKTNPYVDSRGVKYYFGEFFPPELSPFAFNESSAYAYTPLGKNEVQNNGWIWKENQSRSYIPTLLAKDIPDNIKDVSVDIVREIIECEHREECDEQCTKAFRIIEQELQFYKTKNIPLPRLCPNCRHYKRIKKLPEFRLFSRSCMCDKTTHQHGAGKCEVEFETSYAPDRPEIVYCEKCYQQEVY